MTKYTNIPYLKLPETQFQVHLSDVLLNTGYDPSVVYLYNPATKVLTLLPASAPGRSGDIAHTTSKLWLYGAQIPGQLNAKLEEYDITLNPFSSIFNREIPVVPLSAGLCAIDDTTLICVSYSSVTHLSTINEVDISGHEAVVTPKFDLPENRLISGDYILTTDRKFIVTTMEGTNIYISQFDYDTAAFEMDLDITNDMGYPWGLFEFEDQIYIVDSAKASPNYSKVYIIDKDTPYAITLYDSFSLKFNGASQIPAQLTISFTPDSEGITMDNDIVTMDNDIITMDNEPQ